MLLAAVIWHNKLCCAAGEPAKPVWSGSGTVKSTVFRLVLKSRPKKNEKTNF